MNRGGDMDQTDRLAYEVAMAALRDTREDCLRWLEDQEPEPAAARRRSARWLNRDPRPTPSKRRLAS
jgi:hypothetical protein